MSEVYQMSYFSNEKEVHRVTTELGLFDRPGFPTFDDFVSNWLPDEMVRLLFSMGGGVQTAEVTATIESLYNMFIFFKAGAPKYVISAELIQALRDTEIPNFKIDALKLPFEGIRIDIPKGTFAPPADLVESVYVTNVEHDRFRVIFPHGEWCNFVNMIVDDENKTIHQVIEDTRLNMQDVLAPEFVKKDIELKSQYKDYFTTDVFRFAINTVLYITCPDADMYRDRTEEYALYQQLQGLKKQNKRKILEKEYHKAKESIRYIVGAGFKMDREYTAKLTDNGHKWVLTNRLRVAGHWRQQPHGPKRSLVKQIFIKPYWKGPTYAEMVQRGYVVK